MKLRLNRISLPLAEFPLALDITISEQVTALCGPSGSGKTSLLELITGLRRPKSAFIQLDDQVLTDTAAGVSVPARDRRIGYVPQDLALFPHLSVRRNLLYGHKPESESDAAGLFGFAHVVEVLEVESLTGRNVENLSGGEKQRIALGRALLSSPKLLLLDEPLASLDRALKAKIIPYLTRIRDEFQVPMLLVTHSIEEVFPLCERTIHLERGRVTS